MPRFLTVVFRLTQKKKSFKKHLLRNIMKRKMREIAPYFISYIIFNLSNKWIDWIRWTYDNESSVELFKTNLADPLWKK